jgi:hypothetical protein
MTYEQRKALKPPDCTRACGVPPQTFAKRRHVLREQRQRQGKQGRPAQLSLEAQLFMPLPYGRESRPYFPLGRSWGVAEARVCRPVQRLEHLRLQSQSGPWPGKKKWPAGSTPGAVIVGDGAASPGEGPPKNSGVPPAGRRPAPRKKRPSSWPTSPASFAGSPSAREGQTLLHWSRGAGAP